jgi:hypothetical protein
MLQKLTKHGDSWALVIGPSLLDLLQIDPEKCVDVTAARETERQQRFAEALAKTNRKYGRALKKLGE